MCCIDTCIKGEEGSREWQEGIEGERDSETADINTDVVAESTLLKRKGKVTIVLKLVKNKLCNFPTTTIN